METNTIFPKLGMLGMLIIYGSLTIAYATALAALIALLVIIII